MRNNRMFRIRNLPNIANENFPYVESNFDAVTNYELLSKALKEIKEISKKKIPTKVSELTNDLGYINKIKTVNNQSLLGTGNIHIDGSGYDDTAIWEKVNLIDTDLGTVQDEVQTLSNKVDNVLTADYLDEHKYEIVKNGLVGNTIVLTDSEKLGIEAWLGLSENYLTYYNTTPYQVNGNYVPAHKKYVDDLVGNIESLLQAIDTGAGV